MAIKLLIYEDNTRLRQSLELLLSDGSGFVVAGAFPDCDAVEEQVRTMEPALVIMDIDMPGMNGVEGVRRIKTEFPHIKVIMYTV